jgi:diguanylate cyclase (GGDEF)-like protein
MKDTVKRDLPIGLALSADRAPLLFRMVRRLECLLVVLVAAYQVLMFGQERMSVPLGAATLLFAVFIAARQYFEFFGKRTQLQLVLESWAMIIFVTWTVLHTGRGDSPLINLYVLVGIAIGLLLSSRGTLFQVGIIAGCYVWLNYPSTVPVSGAWYAAKLAYGIAPIVVAAYITTVLSGADRFRVAKDARVDELTGLLNMRGFSSIAERVLHQARRYNRVFSILMIDVDGLKSVNDRYSHRTGSELLKELARSAQSTCRDSDIVVRYGDDAFLMLLPETTSKGAAEVGTRIRQRVESTLVPVGEKAAGITASVGVVSFPEHASELSGLIRRTEEALQSSKSRGGNSVTVAGMPSYGS